jgi:ABC-type transporter Mla maintaining outer membrane lipid asymmetry ATPase subunit MlaF
LFEEPPQGLDPVVSAVIDKLIVDFTERQRVTSVISSSAIGFPAVA